MSLSKREADPDPFVQFHLWLTQAVESEIEDASAMMLSTVNAMGIPSSRMVLLKEADKDGLVFFTNHTSRKGEEMSINPQVALLFYWKELERQVRIGGMVRRISREESETYYYSRPRESQISAMISPQSMSITDREWLELRWEEASQSYQENPPPFPERWGGYRVIPVEFEFFQGREHRLHDRLRYLKQGESWHIERLAP